MARKVVVDAGFLVALLSRRDLHHAWALQQASENPPPWLTCEAALSEAHHLLGKPGAPALQLMLSRRAVVSAFNLDENVDPIIALLHKYATVPMSLADACLVRMSETLSDPLILTTDSDFRIYRRHSRQVIPTIVPPRSRS